MGVAERIIAGLGVGWIEKLLDRTLSRRREDRKEITDLINLDIDQFRRLYIEPDFQPYNPANAEDDEEDEVESKFRIAAYEWLDSFLIDPKKKDGRHVAFILSDAGMGKTSLLAMLKLSSIVDSDLLARNELQATEIGAVNSRRNQRIHGILYGQNCSFAG